MDDHRPRPALPEAPAVQGLRPAVALLVRPEVQPHLVDRVRGRRRTVLVVGPRCGGIGAAGRGVHVHPVRTAGHQPRSRAPTRVPDGSANWVTSIRAPAGTSRVSYVSASDGTKEPGGENTPAARVHELPPAATTSSVRLGSPPPPGSCAEPPPRAHRARRGRQGRRTRRRRLRGRHRRRRPASAGPPCPPAGQAPVRPPAPRHRVVLTSRRPPPPRIRVRRTVSRPYHPCRHALLLARAGRSPRLTGTRPPGVRDLHNITRPARCPDAPHAYAVQLNLPPMPLPCDVAALTRSGSSRRC